MPATPYTRDILRLAASVPHLGRLASPGGSAERRAPLCGSRIALDVVLNAEGRVTAIGQDLSACAFGQAAAALMGQGALGRSADELAAACAALGNWLAGRRDDPGDWPGLAALAPARPLTARHGAILLPFEAVAEAAHRAIQALSLEREGGMRVSDVRHTASSSIPPRDGNSTDRLTMPARRERR